MMFLKFYKYKRSKKNIYWQGECGSYKWASGSKVVCEVHGETLAKQIVWKILSDGNWVMMPNKCEKLSDEWWKLSDEKSEAK